MKKTETQNSRKIYQFYYNYCRNSGYDNFKDFKCKIGKSPSPNYHITRKDLNKGYDISNLEWASIENRTSKYTVNGLDNRHRSLLAECRKISLKYSNVINVIRNYKLEDLPQAALAFQKMDKVQRRVFKKHAVTEAIKTLALK